MDELAPVTCTGTRFLRFLVLAYIHVTSVPSLGPEAILNPLLNLKQGVDRQIYCALGKGSSFPKSMLWRGHLLNPTIKGTIPVL